MTAREHFKEEIKKAIESTPNKNTIASVSLFGSYLHGDNHQNSDIDLLVDFHQPVGLFTLIGIQDSLGKKLGRKVDLRTPGDLSHFIRSKVVNEAERIYG